MAKNITIIILSVIVATLGILLGLENKKRRDLEKINPGQKRVNNSSKIKETFNQIKSRLKEIDVLLNSKITPELSELLKKEKSNLVSLAINMCQICRNENQGDCTNCPGCCEQTNIQGGECWKYANETWCKDCGGCLAYKI